eukprot:13605094-Alexandrium_andersonii.AAC.1
MPRARCALLHDGMASKRCAAGARQPDTRAQRTATSICTEIVSHAQTVMCHESRESHTACD